MSLEGKQIDRYAILHLLGNGTLEMASQLLTNQANLQLGSNYAPVGNITTTLTSATLTDAKSGTITLTVSAEGLWVYQFTAAQKQSLAKLIVGKTKSQAQSQLVSQPGIAHVEIMLSGGNNDTLPADVNKIAFVIKTIPG